MVRQHRFLKDDRDRKKQVMKQRECEGFKVQFKTFVTEASPLVLDRLMPVNCQVVIESCKGTFFKNVVVSLKERNTFRGKG